MTTSLEAPIRPDPLTEPAPTPRARQRLEVVDKLRGFVIVLMVLDHARDFFHGHSLRFSATDLAHTDALLFVTRWITHLCAPTFVFLAGVSIYLQRSNGKRGWLLARFLLTRGLWLVVLELTVVALAFDFAWPMFFLQVIWAIGMSMILLAGLAWMQPRVVLMVGIVVVLGHDALTALKVDGLGALEPLWTLAINRGMIDHVAFVSYPFVPWFGIMALGFGLGGIFEMPPERRNRMLVAIGAGFLFAFAIVRAVNGYGDVKPWSVQRDTTLTVLSFLNVSKYPPSLDYTLVMLGIALSTAPLLERIHGAFGRLLHVFGRTPLFTYVLHLYIVHGLALVVGVASGTPASAFFKFFRDRSRAADAGWGVNLFWTYVVWIAVILILWPLATWFAELKKRRRDWWLSYL